MNDVVLVTGGCGFIGTWVLRELLARQIRAVAFDVVPNPQRWHRLLGERSADVPLEQGRLTDRARLETVCEAHQITHFIHLGALLTPACQTDPWAGCEANVMGSIAVFEQARKSARTRGLSYASSLAVFGPELDDGGTRDVVAENRPKSFYGAFKQAVERIAEQYWLSFQLPSIGIRPHIVYGPERDQGLSAGPSLAARAAAERREFCINYRGTGGYDYVADVAAAFVRSALHTTPGATVVNLPSQPASVEQIVELLGDLAPSSKGLISCDGPFIPLNNPVRSISIDSLYPDWRATTLREGMQATIDFYGPR